MAETIIESNIPNPASRRTDRRNLLLAVLITATAMLLVWPFAEIPFADDFAYTHVALRLTQTGHFLYNGWEFSILVAHVCWGALFIRLFGFSFESVRFSTIPFALGAVAFCYLLVRRAGLKPSYAYLTTLLLGLSPLFVPLSTSYMTDVPCLFFTLAALYALSRAAEEGERFHGYLWLALGTVVGIVGGTGRQVVWLVPLSILPYLAWVMRRQLRFAIASAFAWVLTVGVVAGVSAWFNRQLYVCQQPSTVNELKIAMHEPGRAINIGARLALMLLFVILPAASPLVWRAWLNTWRGTRVRQIFVGTLFLALFCAIYIHPSLASIPWVNSTFNWEGINGTAPLLGRPIVLTTPIRALAALAVYAAVCILAGELLDFRFWAIRAWNCLVNPPDRRFAMPAMFLFSAVYFVLLVIRGMDIDLSDRYLLPFMPCAAAILLLWFCAENHDVKRMQRRAMPFAWIILAVLASYALLSTQDIWSLARARVIATRRLEAAGIPRTAIDAGMEYDGWTQVLTTGHVNERWVKNPPEVYRPGLGTTPEVVPVYRVEYQPTPESIPTQFGTVPYFSLLPPFHKQVSIDRVLAK